MSKLELPNIRRIFLPDPGYTIFDVDEAGADAQVVAWEAEDEMLKEAFRKGLKVHILNCKDMFPDKVKGWSDEAIKKSKLYNENKRAVHGTNYGAAGKTIAATNGWTVHEGDMFQRRWFGAHPGIRKWHERTETLLRTKRMAINAFGYRIIFFDRVDALLPTALAWVPQSTVAHVCFQALVNLEEQCPFVELLIQVHDSIVFQIKNPTDAQLLKVKAALEVPIPYTDPLIIPWGISSSLKSWGDCEGMKWPETRPLVAA